MNRLAIQAYTASKPLARIRALASSLGWHGIQLSSFSACSIEDAPTEETPFGVFYMTTDEKFNLQINENPAGQSRTYQATVKAERYGILHTEWVHFDLSDDAAALAEVIQHMLPLLGRENFKNRKWLRAIKQTDRVRLTRSKKKPRGRRRFAAQ